jgi:hypothetical protein
LAAEVSGKLNITEHLDTTIIALGNWDNLSPKTERGNIHSDVTAAIDSLGKLQSGFKTIIWRTSGFQDDAGASAEFFFEMNKRVLDQINSISIRLQQESNTVSNLTCIN